jgi:hypothetical protein
VMVLGVGIVARQRGVRTTALTEAASRLGIWHPHPLFVGQLLDREAERVVAAKDDPVN